MLRCVALFALLAVAKAGLMCVRCNQARETEEKCNNQKGSPGTVMCDETKQVCTTDVRCDGKGRPYYIKGCQRKRGITALDTLICNDTPGSATRCHRHCDSSMCNLDAPEVAAGLICTPNEPKCTAGFSRDYSGPGPDMTSFSGEIYSFNTQNKFLLAQAFQADPNPCKFQVRCQMDEDNDGNIFLWWCGVAFGVHSNNDAKYSKNFRISQNDDELEVRGQGFGDPQVTSGMAFDIPPGSLFEGTNNGGGTYTITGSYPPDGCMIEVNYADGDPDDKLTLTVSGYDMADINGACVDSCFGYDPETNMDDCIDGAHQNPA